MQPPLPPTSLRQPAPGRHDVNLHAVFDEAVGLVERHHDGAPATAQPCAFDDAAQFPGTTCRRHLVAHLDGGVRRDEVALPQPPRSPA